MLILKRWQQSKTNIHSVHDDTITNTNTTVNLMKIVINCKLIQVDVPFAGSEILQTGFDWVLRPVKLSK